MSALKTVEREGLILAKLRGKLIALMMLVIVFGVFASGCNLIQKNPEAIKKQKVAKVGDEYITRGELDEMFVPVIEQLKASPQYGENFLTSDQGKEMLASQKKEYLNNLVEYKIFEQKSRELKLFKDNSEIDAAVKKEIDGLIEYYKSEDEFNKKIEEAKMNKDTFMKLMRSQVISQKVYDDMVKDLAVSDEDIKKFYDENKAYMTEKPNTMEVSHILVKTVDEAKEIKAQLDKGGNFETIAKEKSIEPAAKESGGKLGEIQYYDPNYDQTFVSAAMGLKEGQISDPVETQFGVHIIKVTKKTEYPVMELDKVKEQIKAQLLSEKQQKKYTDTMTEWKDKSGVKVYDENINNVK